MADEHGIRERQHGLRPDTAVEVDVQLGFG
jgi:hypothetical protein